jgi:peptide deformylase
MLDIKKNKDPALYIKCRAVRDEEFGEDLNKFMSDMAVTMYGSRGTGLAGPQVGSDKRIFVVDIGYLGFKEYGSELLKIVNPVIVWKSEEVIKAEEQCLSYPDFNATVDRSAEITMSYQTPFGERKEETYKSWQARVLLHEFDHLDGVTLYTRSSHMKKKRYEEQIKKKKN